MAKKIKKEKAIIPNKKKNLKDTSALLNLIKSEESKPKERAASVSYKKTPSRRPEFSLWKKKDIDKWTSTDFIGFYLSRYLNVYKYEDVDFYHNNSYKFVKEKVYIKKCLSDYFNDDKELFSEYIEFILDWWITPEAFVDGAASFWSIFTTKKATFFKIYQTSKIKPKIRTRYEMDNQAASKDAWDEYFEEEGE